MMKRFLFITIFGLFFCISSWADRQPIVIQNGGAVGDHGEYFDPADKPECITTSIIRRLSLSPMVLSVPTM